MKIFEIISGHTTYDWKQECNADGGYACCAPFTLQIILTNTRNKV